MPPRTGKPLREVVAFGERVRHYASREGGPGAACRGCRAERRQLSHIENGLNEPKLTTVLRDRSAFKISAGELLQPTAVRVGYGSPSHATTLDLSEIWR